jgi:nucleotide-binding universal stress UspA family protein
MRFRKILCPIDFSPGSRHAMRVAIRLANEADAELVLAHAWHVPPVTFSGEYPFSAGMMQELQDSAQRGLDDAVRDATELGARRLGAKLLAGMPRHELVELLEHDAAFDLVVMGTHGHTGLARVLLGSLAESIVRRAPCSVLAVHPDPAQGPFARVLCPIDFSPSSQHAVDLAAELVQRGSAGVTLLHVIEVPPVNTHGQQTIDFLRELDRSSTEHLASWATQLEGTLPGRVARLSRVGRPGAEILKALDEDPTFDLVVVGSHGRTGLERMLLGSVAEKIVRHARCPVLVARPRAQPA